MLRWHRRSTSIDNPTEWITVAELAEPLTELPADANQALRLAAAAR